MQMKGLKLAGIALIASAVLAPAVLAPFGVVLGQFTVFDASIDNVTITEQRFDPNWFVFIPIALIFLAGIVLLVLPDRR